MKNRQYVDMKPNNIHPLLARLMPFIIIAFMIVIFILALFVFSYVLIATLVIGLIVFVVGFIRAKFFGHKKTAFDKTFFSFEASFGNNPATTKKPTKLNEKTGRVIEHDQEDRNDHS